jgi:ubiquinone/menaquinone biosynthesis C-methylase UbiE
MPRYKAIAAYYDAENEHHSMLEQDVPFFLDHLPRRRKQRVLELAAGTGRAAIPIAQAGHTVVGVDYDPAMLAIARRKRDVVGLSERQLSLVRADILKLNLRQRFDWACILFNTFLVFTTIAQQDAALQVVHRHLKPRGRLWIDIFQPNLALLAREQSVGYDPVLFHVPELDRTVLRSTDVRRDPAAQVQQITFNYRWYDDRGQERREKIEFALTFIFPRELQLLLERNGFRLDRVYGNYDGSALNADSPRMIAVASVR